MTQESGQAKRREAAEHLALALTDAGMQRMAARVPAAFLFTDEPSLTAGDLGEEPGASAGSLFSGIKMVAQMELVERVPVQGSRRVHYRMWDRAWTTLYSRQHAVIDDVRDFYVFLLSEVPALIERFERLRSESRP